MLPYLSANKLAYHSLWTVVEVTGLLSQRQRLILFTAQQSVWAHICICASCPPTLQGWCRGTHRQMLHPQWVCLTAEEASTWKIPIFFKRVLRNLLKLYSGGRHYFLLHRVANSSGLCPRWIHLSPSSKIICSTNTLKKTSSGPKAVSASAHKKHKGLSGDLLTIATEFRDNFLCNNR